MISIPFATNTAPVNPPNHTAVQRRILLDLADLLLLQEVVTSKLRGQANTERFWMHIQLNHRVDELISDRALLCEREHIQREFALLVAGWPQAQDDRASWTAEALVDSATQALEGIVSKRVK